MNVRPSYKRLKELEELIKSHQDRAKKNRWQVVPKSLYFKYGALFDNFPRSKKDSQRLHCFLWDCRPREKDMRRNPSQYRREFCILCCYASDRVYEKNKDTILIGWDAWEAVDGLEKQD